MSLLLYNGIVSCSKIFQFHLPQKGIPCGTQVPLLLQIRRAGPKSSNPLSHEYRATVPGPTELVLNSTVLWAGAPGNPQPTDVSGKRKQKVLLFFHSQEKDVVNIINLFCDKDTIYLFLIVILVQKGHFPTNVFIYLYTLKFYALFTTERYLK